MLSDQNFSNFVRKSNEKIGQQQIDGLLRLKEFVRNQQLQDHRQVEIRRRCLEAWNVPDKFRAAPDTRISPEDRFKALTLDPEYRCKPTRLNSSNLDEIKSAYDFRVLVSGSQKRYMILSLGKSQVYKWDLDHPTKWTRVEELKIEIPRDSILDVEFVEEMRGEGKGLRKVMALHIFDALFLGGTDIRRFHFMDRLEKARKFVRAIHRSTRIDLAPIRIKEPVGLEQIENIFAGLRMKRIKWEEEVEVKRSKSIRAAVSIRGQASFRLDFTSLESSLFRG